MNKLNYTNSVIRTFNSFITKQEKILSDATSGGVNYETTVILFLNLICAIILELFRVKIRELREK